MKNNLSILVIDDEVSLGDVYINFLSKLGATVNYSDHPQKGWRAIEKEKYDLIITDLKMPVIAGDEFISIVRGSKLNSHTPIILCSGFINKLVVTEMTRESKIYFLSKPFDSKSLLELVDKALGVKKSDEESESWALNEKWLAAFTDKLSEVVKEKVNIANINQFELWNFESIGAHFTIMVNNEHLNVSLLMKGKTFLKVAGLVQGTQYKDIEPEILQVWKELLEGALEGTGRVSFSKILSQQIIRQPGHKSAFFKLHGTFGEVLVYLN